MNTSTFRKLALNYDGVEELPHFEKASFRVKNRIFVTLDERNVMATFKLSAIEQSIFCSYDKEIVYPVPNKWGKQGWTIMNLKDAPQELITGALDSAYNEVIKPKKK